MPCASALVRIRLAPLSDDFKRVLGVKDVPKKDWDKKGIWPKSPMYSHGRYNNKFCPIRDNEEKLFNFRNARPEIPIKDSVNLLLRINQINKEMVKEKFI